MPPCPVLRSTLNSLGTHCRVRGRCAEAHLNTCFKHFICFVNEFKLIEASELAPLQEIIDSMLSGKTKVSAPSAA